MESHFLTSIVRPGYILKEAIRQREFLEKEVHRIRRGIITESYPDQKTVEEDIRQVLTSLFFGSARFHRAS